MFKTFLPYILRYKWLLAVSYGTAGVQSIVAALLPLAGKIFFDHVLPARPPVKIIDLFNESNLPGAAEFITGLTTDVYRFAIAAVFLIILMAVLRTVRDLAEFRLQNHLSAALNEDIFAAILATDLKKQQSFERGYLNNRVIADSGAFESLVRNLLPSIINNLLRFVVGLLALWHINKAMTLVCFFVMPVYLLINRLFSAKVRHLAHRSAEMSAENQAFVQKTLDGIETVKAFNLEKKCVQDYRSRLRSLIDTKLGYFITGRVSSGLARLVQLISLLILMVMAQKYYQQGLLSIGDIVTFSGYMGFLSTPLASLAMLYINLQPSLVSLRRVKEMLDLIPEETIPHSGESAAACCNVGEINHKQSFKTPDCLRIRDLFFYHKNDKRLFSGLNIEFRKGHPAFVDWPSGSGKTTLARLLMKYLEPESGIIELDGNSYNEISRKELRSMIGYRPQNDFFFCGTVRENLLIASPESDDAEIIKALRLCCADFIIDSHEGIDLMLGDGAVNISEGQRARLSLTRVVLRDPAIIILDEPFAAIDQNTADKIMANLQDFFKNRITVIFSHRKAGQASEKKHI